MARNESAIADNACIVAQASPREHGSTATLGPMTSSAYVFPGQGSQSVGMGQALAAASPAAAAVLAAADAALGESISSLAADGPADLLDRTENAQPALLAVSIAYLAAVRERWAALGIDAEPPAFAAGHSMGQYSALVAAEVISLEDGVRLVRERGRLMQASGAGRDGAMAAILGLDDAALPALVERASANGVFGVANRNAPGQVVVSGERAAIEAAAEIAKELGARKAIVLPVSVAAHSPLMAEAAEGMRRALADVDVPRPGRAAPRQCRRPADHDGRRRPGRARRAPHRRRRLGRCRRADGRGRRDDLHRGRAGPGPHRISSSGSPRTPRRSHSTIRPRPTVSAFPSRRQRPPDPASRKDSSHVRKPDYDRRVVVTGLGVISPVGNDVQTAWGNLIRGKSGLAEITKFDVSRYEAKAAGEVHDFNATDWMDPKAVRRSESAM